MRGRPSIVAATLLALFTIGLWNSTAAYGQKVRVAVLPLENNSTWHYWGDNLGAAAGSNPNLHFTTAALRCRCQERQAQTDPAGGAGSDEGILEPV